MTMMEKNLKGGTMAVSFRLLIPLGILLVGCCLTEGKVLSPNQYAKQHSLRRSLSSTSAAMGSLDSFEVDSDEYEAAKELMVGRSLQQISPDDNLVHSGSAGDFVAPCISLPSQLDAIVADGWTQVPSNDDSSVSTTLDFDFDFYGTRYPAGSQIWINNNGNLNFGTSGLSQFTADPFPLSGTPMIAPFWSDVDTRRIGNNASDASNRVWYKMENDRLTVVWDRVGYFSRRTDKRNTFQVVISSSSLSSDDENVCFCYVDMDWTTGGASGGVDGFGGAAATVGVNRGESSDFVQLGRFDQPGSDYDGGGGNMDGVDYLDGRIGVFSGGSDNRQALCLDVRSVNVPPIVMGFPINGANVGVDCGESFLKTLSFASPELDQTMNVTYSSLPNGMTANVTGQNSSTVMIVLEWTPAPTQQGITHAIDFLATDDLATVAETLRIDVMGGCDNQNNNTMLLPSPACTLLDLDNLGNDTCTANSGPYCTPWRSLDHCPLDESFATLIRERQDIASTDPTLVESLGYWFHFLEDKGAGYALTASQGFRAPQVYCCSYGLLADCFPLQIPPTDGFVVRASTIHGSGSVFVSPNGFGGVELLRDINMTLQDVEVALSLLHQQLEPLKILVEEFVGGSGSLLPTEFKFHMFDGEIGSVTVIQNRGTDCGCFAEVDEDWNRLDEYGCFVPSGQELRTSGSVCHDIDFVSGQSDPYPFKGFNRCREVMRVDDCVWEDMKQVARSLSRTIGVYVRVDMFVDENNVVYVQEYTTNHNNGLRHCSAKVSSNGTCVDSCFLGRLWKGLGNDTVVGSDSFGGLPTAVPNVLTNWSMHSHVDQCDVVAMTALNVSFTSSCL